MYTGDELPAQAKKMPAFNRVPLAQRLAALDNVGTCLIKEEVRVDICSYALVRGRLKYHSDILFAQTQAARTDFSGYTMKSFNAPCEFTVFYVCSCLDDF